MSEIPVLEVAKPVNSITLSRRQIWFTVVGLMLSTFLCSLDQTIVGTAMPRIVVDLGGFNQYTWVTTTYIVVLAVTTPITGKLIDMYGRKIFCVISLIIFVVASLLCGFSQTMTQLIIFRGVQAIGAAIMISATFIVIADLFPPEERGKYGGYISVVFAVSSVIGPTLGGFLTDSLSWHWIFFINVPLGILVIALFIKYFPNIRIGNVKSSIDYPGLLVLILLVIPVMLALQIGGVEYPWASLPIIGLFVFSAVMLVLFIYIERRAKEPILPLSLFKNRILTVSSVLSFLIYIGFFATITFIPLFLQGVLGLSATASGNLLIPMLLSSTVGSLLSGQLLSRAGNRYRTQGLIGVALMAVGLFLLSKLTATTSQATIILDSLIFGLGVGITFPLYTVAVQNTVSNDMLGVATSTVTFFRLTGGSVGLAILGSVMNNRFAMEFLGKIPESVKSIIPADTLSSLATNPRALINPEAQSQLQEILNQTSSQGLSLYEQVLKGLREALASSLAEVFLFCFVITIIGFIVHFLLKEKPLRQRHSTADKIAAAPLACRKCIPDGYAHRVCIWSFG